MYGARPCQSYWKLSACDGETFSELKGNGLSVHRYSVWVITHVWITLFGVFAYGTIFKGNKDEPHFTVEVGHFDYFASGTIRESICNVDIAC